MEKKTLSLLLSICIIIFVICIDQILKFWIKCNFHLGENVFDLGVLRFDFVENPGMAFGWSFGSQLSKSLLSIFRILAVLGIGYYIIKLIKTNANLVFICLVSLIFAGAFGNIIDNLFYGLIFDSGTTWNDYVGGWVPYSGISKADFSGYSGLLSGCVVDMIHLVFYWPEWAPFGLEGEIFPPVFNVADFFISLSVFIILLFYKKLVRKQDLELSLKKKS